MSDRPLLMIPGPVEVSPAVRRACDLAPPGHLAPPVIEAFGSALERMRRVWRAGPEAQPFVVPGGGTLAMEMSVANLADAGCRAVVVNTGYFSDRIATMLRRHGAEVLEVGTEEPGQAPPLDAVAEALERKAGDRPQILAATHVDTSTGVRIDPAPLARLAREHGALSVFDGVCATAAEPFEMGAWQADVYLTGSQKALGLPPGLALAVVSQAALERRDRLAAPPALALDWQAWLPIMQAYEDRRPSYFGTPATALIPALNVALGEIEEQGVEATWRQHARAARACRAAWEQLGLRPVPRRPELLASTLSALFYPSGVDASLIGRVAARGVVVAGGLHPAIRDRYFRVGHMGYSAGSVEILGKTVDAVAGGLEEGGYRADREAAREAFDEAWEMPLKRAD